MIKILDCTLRDGGYYTNWDFDNLLVEEYLKSCNSLPIDYIEVGYRSLPQQEYLGKYFYCPDFVIKKIKKHYHKKIAIMLNEKDVMCSDLDYLLHSIVGEVDMIRLAVDPQNIKRAVELAKHIKRFNFEIAFNVMYMTKWKAIENFFECILLVNEVADYFYLVDSYGGVYPNEVKEICNSVKQKLTIPFGFHGHNNMELALINSLTALDCGASLLDVTITGMGRGAGNLKTELLLTALQAKGLLDFNFNKLSDVIQMFESLQEKYKWGTNLPYMVSGANSLPQKDVMDWVGKRYYSYNSIIRSLNNQKTKVEDNERFDIFNPIQSKNIILIVGGGTSVLEHIDYILLFLKNNPEIAVIHSSSRNAYNFKDIQNQQYFCLTGNEGSRLEKVLGNFNPDDSLFILPSYPRKMGTYVPEFVKLKTKELKSIDFINDLKDTHTSIALQTTIELKAKEIYIIGYDGYTNNSISGRELELFNENEFIFKTFIKHQKILLKSLTPTLYKSLVSDSIYSKF